MEHKKLKELVQLYASDELKAEIAECWVNAREPEVKNDN